MRSERLRICIDETPSPCPHQAQSGPLNSGYELPSSRELALGSLATGLPSEVRARARAATWRCAGLSVPTSVSLPLPRILPAGRNKGLSKIQYSGKDRFLQNALEPKRHN